MVRVVSTKRGPSQYGKVMPTRTERTTRGADLLHQMRGIIHPNELPLLEGTHLSPKTVDLTLASLRERAGPKGKASLVELVKQRTPQQEHLDSLALALFGDYRFFGPVFIQNMNK